MQMLEITIDGYTYPDLKDACRAYGINYLTAYWRIKRGWGIDKALKTPVCNCTLSKDHLGNMYPSIRKMCKAYGLNYHTFHWRINKGWSIEKILTTPIDKSKRNKAR